MNQDFPPAYFQGRTRITSGSKYENMKFEIHDRDHHGWREMTEEERAAFVRENPQQPIKFSPWYFLGRVRLMVTKFTKDKDTNGSNCRLQINDKHCGWRDFTEEEYAAWKLHDQPGTPVPTIAEEFSNVLSVEGIRSLYQNRIKAAFEKNFDGVREINMQLAEAIPYLLGQIDVYKAGVFTSLPNEPQQDEPQIDPPFPWSERLSQFIDEITAIEETPTQLYWESKLSKSEILYALRMLLRQYVPSIPGHKILDRQGWQPIENWQDPGEPDWVLVWSRRADLPNDDLYPNEAVWNPTTKCFYTTDEEWKFHVTHFMPLPRGPHGE